MMKYSYLAGAAAAALLTVLVWPDPAVGSRPSSPTTASVPTSVNHEPDPGFWWENKPRQVTWTWNGYQWASVTYSSTEQEVRVKWAGAYDPVSDSQDSEYLTYPVTFYPTDVDLVGNDKLLVVGKGRNNDTIIELWRFTWPGQMTSPAYNIGGGFYYDVVVPALVSKIRSYDADVAGKRQIRAGMCLRNSTTGQVQHALIQFHDSSDLYDVNLSDGSMVLVAGPATTGTLGAIPELGSFFELTWSGDHQDHGYIYVFGFSDNVLTGDPSTVVFKDSDRNGVLDSYQVIAPGAWDATVFADDSKYIW